MSNDDAFQWFLYPDCYKLVRLSRDKEESKPYVDLETFVAVTYTPDAIALICLESDNIPDGTIISDNWRVLQVKGPYEEQNAKQVELIVRVLRTAGIEIHASPAFDTDYLLLKNDQIAEALDALERAEQSVDHRQKSKVSTG